jgi:hypothetical protein
MEFFLAVVFMANLATTTMTIIIIIIMHRNFWEES